MGIYYNENMTEFRKFDFLKRCGSTFRGKVEPQLFTKSNVLKSCHVLIVMCPLTLLVSIHYTNVARMHAVTGSMAFCTLEGENDIQCDAEGAICPRGCTKPMYPRHIGNNCFVIPLFNCYSSSQSFVVIFKHYHNGLFIV